MDISDAVLGLSSNIANVAGAYASISGTKKQQKRAHEYNMKMAQFQNDVALANWNRQNEYNSPSAQMERLSAAGLNPNLVYGNGADNTATALSAANAPYDNSYVDYSAMGNAISSGVSNALDMALKAAGVEKAQQETENLSQYNVLQHQQQQLNQLQIVANGLANAKTKVEQDYWKKILDAKYNNLVAEGALTSARTTYTGSQNHYLLNQQTDLAETQADLNRANTSLSGANASKAFSDIALNAVRAQQMQRQMSLMLSQIGLNNAQTNYVLEQINNARWDSKLKRATLYGKDLDNWFKEVLKKLVLILVLKA